MICTPASPARPNYGIDAPGVMRRFAFIGRAGLLVGIILLLLSGSVIPTGLAIRLAIPSLCMGGTFFMISFVMLLGKGMADVKRSGPNFLFAIPSYTLTATKPGPLRT